MQFLSLASLAALTMAGFSAAQSDTEVGMVCPTSMGPRTRARRTPTAGGSPSTACVIPSEAHCTQTTSFAAQERREGRHRFLPERMQQEGRYYALAFPV
ncbi:hypothetical protein PG987_009013 [Apiospora arundinis]